MQLLSLLPILILLLYLLVSISLHRSRVHWFIASRSLGEATKLLLSDSETAFLRFENLFCVICLCLLKIFLFIVCLFVRIYPIVCLCGVNRRSFFLLLISQLCSTIACLFPNLFSDRRFRMIDAELLLMISIS